MLARRAQPGSGRDAEKIEAEKTELEAQLATRPAPAPSAEVLPDPARIRLFEQKVGALRESLDHETVRGDAAEILPTLIESVTIYPDGENGPEAEVVTRVADLMAFTTNDNTAPKGRRVVFYGVGCGDRI